jgi:hypothetical protein
MIVKSALKATDGTVHTGHRHADIFRDRDSGKVGGERYFLNAEQGFVSDTGEFLNRVDAAKHAIACGQIKETRWGVRLYSEDLW